MSHKQPQYRGVTGKLDGDVYASPGQEEGAPVRVDVGERPPSGHSCAVSIQIVVVVVQSPIQVVR